MSFASLSPSSTKSGVGTNQNCNPNTPGMIAVVNQPNSARTELNSKMHNVVRSIQYGNENTIVSESDNTVQLLSKQGKVR